MEAAGVQWAGGVYPPRWDVAQHLLLTRLHSAKDAVCPAVQSVNQRPSGARPPDHTLLPLPLPLRFIQGAAVSPSAVCPCPLHLTPGPGVVGGAECKEPWLWGEGKEMGKVLSADRNDCRKEGLRPPGPARH